MEILILRTKTRQEVAEEYCISVKTLSRWLKKANIILPRGLIKPFQLQIIYDTFGVPKKTQIAS